MSLERHNAEAQAAGSRQHPRCRAPLVEQAGTIDSGLRPLQHRDVPRCEKRLVRSMLLTLSRPR